MFESCADRKVPCTDVWKFYTASVGVGVGVRWVGAVGVLVVSC